MAFKTQFLQYICLALVIILALWPSLALARPLDQEASTLLSLRQRHEQWMAKHGRVYKDSVEKEKRFNIFKENVERVEKFNNESNHRYRLGINSFSDLTIEEFRSIYIQKSRLPSLPKSNGRFRYENFTRPPESKDWNADGAVTPIKNQGQCACCWSFSTVAAIEGLDQIKTGELTPLSEQQFVDCNTDNHGCDGDGRMDRAMDYLKGTGGVATEDDYPYEGAAGECQAPDSGVNIDGHEAVPAGDEDALMQAVAKQPVCIGLDGNQQDFKDYAGGVYDGSCVEEFNHAVTAIGYGTDDDGTDYWLVKNSWGDGWGEQGFMKLVRGQNKCGVANEAVYPV